MIDLVLFKKENGAEYQNKLRQQFYYQIDPRLRAVNMEAALWVYDQFRKKWIITCVNRTKEENKKVGGSQFSAHLDARADDVRSWTFEKSEKIQIVKHLYEVWGQDFLYVIHHTTNNAEHFHINIRYHHKRYRHAL